MYKVLVADDEPLALKSICSIVNRRSRNYQVIDTAENGQEALQKIRALKPDLVICDIIMPLLTGTELAEIVRTEFPEICFMIVSGYQDFEYAQSAMRSGVSDYLLKPIVPQALLKSLELAEERIKSTQYNEKKKILRALGKGETVDMERIRRYMPYQKYYGVLLRTNGLPRRFALERSREVYSDIMEQFDVFGRDEMESLYLIPAELLQEEAFQSFLDKIESRQNKDNYYTLIYDSVPFSPEQIQEKIRSLYQNLDQRSSVGYIQRINLNEVPSDTTFSASEGRKKEENFLSVLENAIHSKKSEMIQKVLMTGYEEMEAYHLPQLWMEHLTREVLSIFIRNGLCEISMTESEYLLSDAFFNASSVKILVETLLDIFVDFDKYEKGSKVDSQEYFDKIVTFLQGNLSNPISLQELSNTFAISQAYMSKLFRKYSGSSFNQYLTELRMNRAKELFRDNPDSYIKDVANLVGYEDQFYFSRIFRTYTGKSPSDFLKDISKGIEN